MSVFYSEWEKFPAQWLRNAGAANAIAPGVVDERSIEDLVAEDVRGAAQFHAFAGIGVWSYALRLAGIPDDFSVWTGSCPCQPFSQAGKGKGLEDDRHLWPAWFRLVEKHRPHLLLGEQSSSPDALEWFDVVSTQLEGIGYTVGACITNAARIGAPHIRHRIYFVAHTEEFRWPEGWYGRASSRLDEAWLEFERHGDARGIADAYRESYEISFDRGGRQGDGPAPRSGVRPESRPASGSEPDVGVADSVRAGRAEWRPESGGGSSAGSGGAGELADTDRERLEGERLLVRERRPLEDLPEAPRGSEIGRRAFREFRASLRLVDTDGVGRGQDRLPVAEGHGADRERQAGELGHAGTTRELGNARGEGGGWVSGTVSGTEGQSSVDGNRRVVDQPLHAGRVDGVGDASGSGLPEQQRERGVAPAAGGGGAGQAALRAGSPLGGFWTDAVWLYCRDGKYRPTESRVVTLDDGSAGVLDFLRPLEVGVEGRVGKIKAYGNAINALQAATFIRAFMDCTKHL